MEDCQCLGIEIYKTASIMDTPESERLFLDLIHLDFYILAVGIRSQLDVFSLARTV